MKNFNQTKEDYIEKLSQYVPIVARVHGENHPEFYEVAGIYANIEAKINANKQVDLSREFKSLRKITNHYAIPDDVCESYQAVYEMLSRLDQAYFM